MVKIKRNTDKLIDKGKEQKVIDSYNELWPNNWLYVCTWDLQDTIDNDMRIGMLCCVESILESDMEKLKGYAKESAKKHNLDMPMDFNLDQYNDDGTCQIGWIQPVN